MALLCIMTLSTIIIIYHIKFRITTVRGAARRRTREFADPRQTDDSIVTIFTIIIGVGRRVQRRIPRACYYTHTIQYEL